MDFIRWYSRPVFAGFFFGFFVNPVEAAVGLGIWLALIYYLYRRIPEA